MKKNIALLALTGVLTLAACAGPPVSGHDPSHPVATPRLAVPILDANGQATHLSADLYPDYSIVRLDGPPTCFEWTADQFLSKEGVWHPMSGAQAKDNIYAGERRIPAGLNQHVQFRGVPPDRVSRPCQP